MRVAESLVALALGAAVLAGAWQAVARQARAAAGFADAVRRHEAVRNALLVLDWEFMGGAHQAQATGDDGVRMRVFRGWGSVCTRDGDGVLVAWRGLRRPDAARDSLLVLTDAGIEVGLRLARVRTASVDAGECIGAALGDAVEGLWLGWDGGGPASAGAPVVVRAFESGDYLVTSALRYRRGRGTPQPLTADVFDEAGSGWRFTPEGAPGLALVAGPVRVGVRW